MEIRRIVGTEENLTPLLGVAGIGGAVVAISTYLFTMSFLGHRWAGVLGFVIVLVTSITFFSFVARQYGRRRNQVTAR